jgi:hypothetical protein
MNQPTAIIVTEIIIRNGIGREVNPFGNNTPHWLNFESAVKSYPCPSIANTEPGKTVLAELINEFWDGKRWVECNREIPFDFYQGDTTRQIWVPIVEQKEGEGKFGEWASVEDRLPGNSLRVLCCEGNKIEIARFWSDTKQFYSLGADAFMKPTHWMILPEPPNKK